MWFDGRKFLVESLAMFCDLPLRLIDSGVHAAEGEKRREAELRWR